MFNVRSCVLFHSFLPRSDLPETQPQRGRHAGGRRDGRRRCGRPRSREARRGEARPRLGSRRWPARGAPGSLVPALLLLFNVGSWCRYFVRSLAFLGSVTRRGKCHARVVASLLFSFAFPAFSGWPPTDENSPAGMPERGRDRPRAGGGHGDEGREPGLRRGHGQHTTRAAGIKKFLRYGQALRCRLLLQGIAVPPGPGPLVPLHLQCLRPAPPLPHHRLGIHHVKRSQQGHGHTHRRRGLS